MRTIVRYTYAAAAIALVYLGWTYATRIIADRQTERAAKASPAPAFWESFGLGGTTVKILQFYAYPEVITEGEKVSLCYGVANAKSVLVQPGVGPVWPSLSRCLEIAPEEDTRYAVTAQGLDGRSVSQSFIIQVGPDPAKLPKILYFSVRGKQRARNVLGPGVTDGNGMLFTLCFETENAEQVSVEPPVTPPSAAFKGCFWVAPQQTTTYTLTAVGHKGRKAQQQLAIQVP